MNPFPKSSSNGIKQERQDPPPPPFLASTSIKRPRLSMTSTLSASTADTVNHEPRSYATATFPRPSSANGRQSAATRIFMYSASSAPGYTHSFGSPSPLGPLSPLSSLPPTQTSLAPTTPDDRKNAAPNPSVQPVIHKPDCYNDLDEALRCYTLQQEALKKAEEAEKDARNQLRERESQRIIHLNDSAKARSACLRTVRQIRRESLLEYIADNAPMPDIVDLLVQHMDEKTVLTQVVEHVPREVLLGCMVEKVSREDAEKTVLRLLKIKWGEATTGEEGQAIGGD